MIPFDFAYYQPDTAESAVHTFITLDQQGKRPMFYGGGTEIISMSRMANISPAAVIDIKDIPQCRVMEMQDDNLVIGAGVTLTQIHEASIFPLLGAAGARVADRTIQNKITLGGNVCGTIIYREAVLPLLLANCDVVSFGPHGISTHPIREVFKQGMQLDKGELILQFRIKKRFLSYPHLHIKCTRQDKIHYPLVTICAMKVDNLICTAFSGLCEFPFRSLTMENELNNMMLPLEKRADNAIDAVPDTILDNLEGSSAYRKFVLRNLLIKVMNTLEGL